MTIALVVLVAGLGLFAAVLGARWAEAEHWRRSLTAYRLHLPAGLTPDDVARWLGSVAASTHAPRWSLLPLPPVAVEVVSTVDGIAHYLLVAESAQPRMLSGLRASLPGSRLSEAPEFLEYQEPVTVAAELTMTSRRRPLAFERAEAVSAGLLASLQPLHPGEEVRVQYCLTSAGTPMPVASRAGTGRGQQVPWWLEVDGPRDADDIRAERLKQREPLLQATWRIGITAGSHERAYALLGRSWSVVHGLNAPGVRLVRRWLPSSVVVRRLQARTLPVAHWPLLLNSRELVGLTGFPLREVSLPGLTLGAARQLAPSPAMPTTGLVLADSNYPGVVQPLALRTRDRLQHVYLVGPTGVGKSTLIAGMALQDIAAGNGLALIDPKGDLVADVLARIPKERRDDVVVLDPAATDQPVGFNLLGAVHGEHGRELVVDHVVHIMSALWQDSWGPRTSDVLRSALLTLTHTKPADGSRFTLVEVPELLTNPSFRRFVTGQPTVPASVRPFWYAFEQMNEAQRLQVVGPAQNKLRQFTTRTSLRLMLGQSAGFDLGEIFRSRKVLLVPLNKGVIGTETAQLLGALLVASLWQATLSRARVPAERRRPAFIYLDEFQDVLRLPLDVADMLAQARGLGVGLTLAHQHLGQLPEAVKTSVLGTARTQAVFQLDYDDARTLSRSFAPLSADDLMGFPAYEIALRPSVDGHVLRPVTGTTRPLAEPTAVPEDVALASRQRYGAPRAEVEAALRSRTGNRAEATPESAPNGDRPAGYGRRRGGRP